MSSQEKEQWHDAISIVTQGDAMTDPPDYADNDDFSRGGKREDQVRSETDSNDGLDSVSQSDVEQGSVQSTKKPWETYAVFGPDKKCVFSSTMPGVTMGFRISFIGESLYTTSYQDHPSSICSYAISPHGDELAIHIGRGNEVPGWGWRGSQVKNAPTYSSLKAWLNEVLGDCPQDFRYTRVVFGPGASYFASCGERATWHDLPPELNDAIKSYQDAVTFAHEEKERLARDPSVGSITTIKVNGIKGTFDQCVFNSESLPKTRLPRIVALGSDGYFVACFDKGFVVQKLPVDHVLLARLKTDSPSQRARYDSITLSPLDSRFFVLVEKGGNYLMFTHSSEHPLMSQWMYMHTQQIAKAQDTAFDCHQKAKEGDKKHARIDSTTDYSYNADGSAGGKKSNPFDETKGSDSPDKEKKQGRLSRLFSKSKPEKTKD